MKDPQISLTRLNSNGLSNNARRIRLYRGADRQLIRRPEGSASSAMHGFVRLRYLIVPQSLEPILPQNADERPEIASHDTSPPPSALPHLGRPRLPWTAKSPHERDRGVWFSQTTGVCQTQLDLTCKEQGKYRYSENH